MVKKKAGIAKKLFLYGAVLTSSVAISVAITVPLAATVLAIRSILPKREPEPDGQCGSTLEVGGKDLKFRSDPRDGDAYTFKCSECKKENWVDACLVTPAMRSAARG